ncbi:MAG: hypothetical protein H6621_05885 [Halobacteriovoraceae bacterium]|nr:hypothetical protein [Halobacteriovoraceae bacterium]
MHFKGCYAGQYIKRIKAFSKSRLEESNEYVLTVDCVKVTGQTLYCRILRFEKLKDIKIPF